MNDMLKKNIENDGHKYILIEAIHNKCTLDMIESIVLYLKVYYKSEFFDWFEVIFVFENFQLKITQFIYFYY